MTSTPGTTCQQMRSARDVQLANISPPHKRMRTARVLLRRCPDAHGVTPVRCKRCASNRLRQEVRVIERPFYLQKLKAPLLDVVCHKIPPAMDVSCPRCSRLVLCQKSRTSTVCHENNWCREDHAHLHGTSYSITLSAEGNRLMNERGFHHRVVQGVLRDAQTQANRQLLHV